jgi:hypothetical protein
MNAVGGIPPSAANNTLEPTGSTFANRRTRLCAGGSP